MECLGWVPVTRTSPEITHVSDASFASFGAPFGTTITIVTNPTASTLVCIGTPTAIRTAHASTGVMRG